jgi:transcriptional activator SPT7
MLRNGLPPTRSSSDHDPTPTALPTLPSESRRRRSKPKGGPSPNTLLSQINANIRTLRRVRRTHTKYAALNQTHNPEGSNVDGGAAAAEAPDADGVGGEVDDHINEWPWKPPKGVSGIDLGAERATDCLRWMSRKILEHAGFHGIHVLLRLIESRR